MTFHEDLPVAASQPAELAHASIHWVTLLVDASGSMGAIQQPTIEALSAFVQRQEHQPTTRLEVVAFDSDLMGRLRLVPLLHAPKSHAGDRTLPGQSTALAAWRYKPFGDTPLLAAVMAMINSLERDVRAQDQALLVIQTDGIENASPRHITKAAVKQRVQAKIAEGNWQFAYLGPELDAWVTGEDLGIGGLNALSYAATAEGVVGAYATTADGVDRWRNERRRTPALATHFYPLQLPAPRQDGAR